MPKPGYGWEHQKARKLAIDNLIEGTLCWRCRRPMFRRQSLDLDHTVPIAMGGINGPTRLTHSVCNRRAGQLMGARIRRLRTNRYGQFRNRGGSSNRASNRRRQLPEW